MRRAASGGGTLSWGLVALVFLVVWLAGAVNGSDFEGKAFQMREDFGTEPLSQCVLQYYYYIPCPTYAWFWAWIGPDCGDAVGVFFEIGDLSTGGFASCDPGQCHSLETLRILDWAGVWDRIPRPLHRGVRRLLLGSIRVSHWPQPLDERSVGDPFRVELR